MKNTNTKIKTKMAALVMSAAMLMGVFGLAGCAKPDAPEAVAYELGAGAAEGLALTAGTDENGATIAAVWDAAGIEALNTEAVEARNAEIDAWNAKYAKKDTDEKAPGAEEPDLGGEVTYLVSIAGLAAGEDAPIAGETEGETEVAPEAAAEDEAAETEAVAKDEAGAEAYAAEAEVIVGEPTRTEATEYVFTGLAWNREYTVTVVAVYGGSESEAAVATAKTGVPEILSPAVTATGTSTSAITVRWEAAEGATGYFVECTDDPEAAEWFALETAAGDATEYVLEGRGENETVYFRVSAMYEDYKYEPGETDKATTKVTPKATSAATGSGTGTAAAAGTGNTSGGDTGSGTTPAPAPVPIYDYWMTSDGMFWANEDECIDHAYDVLWETDISLHWGHYWGPGSREEAYAEISAQYGW
jgi:hypothetical protein